MKTLLGDPRENGLLHLAGEKPEKVERTPEGYTVSTYRPEPPKRLPDTLLEALSRDDLSDEWRREIAAREVKGRPYEGYGTETKSTAFNKKTGKHEDLYAWGRYQMTPAALKDAGMMRSDGSWSGKYEINSALDFLNNPQAQEAAFKDLTATFDRYVRDQGHSGRIGKMLKGVKEDFEVSQSGLVAAIHRQGIGTVGEYFDWLEKNAWNSRDNIESLPDGQKAKFKSVETRLREFQNLPYK